jgi:hypothetical protein
MRRALDAALALLAMAFAAPSLTYPFSRDQALYWYVGREWLDGAVPYRDVLEHKTPLVYAVHALCAAVAGETMWAIRAAEIVVIALVGWLAARLAAPRRGRVAPGALGASWLVASVFTYGYLPYQDQAHCESWCILFALASVSAARHARGDDAAALAAGTLLGVGFVAKPPVLAFVPLVAAALHARPRHARALRSLLLASLGFVAVVALVLVYFAARGALGDLFDVAVFANAAFAREGATVHTPGQWLARLFEVLDWFQPWSWIFLACCLAGVARGFARRDPGLTRRYALPLAWAACAYVAVFVQMKFHGYQHALFVAPCALLGATLWNDLARLVRHRRLVPRPVAAAGFAATVLVTCVADTPPDVWCLRARNAVRFAAGRIDAPALVDSFDDPRWLDMASAHAAGEWVRSHAAPGERLLVRAYEPEIYFFAGRRYGGRFFWSSVLVSPKLAYRREEWLAQDRTDVERLRPAWVVAMPESEAECESPAWFERMGWEPQAAIGRFVVLYRPPRAGAIQ